MASCSEVLTKGDEIPLNIQDEDILVGENVGFNRIRRITGYLVGTTDRFNDAKRSEEHDRVRHSVSL